MLENIVDFIGSGVLGGVVGLVGTWLKSREEREQKKLDHQHALEMRTLDLKEMTHEAELALRQTKTELAGKQAIAQTEADAARDVAAADTQQASYRHDRITYAKGVLGALAGGLGNFMRALLVFVDVIRGLMRPTITLYLLIVESAIAWMLYKVLSTLGGIPASQVAELLVMVVSGVIFLTTTAVTWWFGTRPNSRGRQ